VTPASETAPRADEDAAQGPPAIALRSVSIVTRRRGRIVEDITADIAGGSLCVLVGPAGSGHSALLMAMTGRFRISDGHITIGNKRLPEHERWARRHMSFLMSGAEAGPDDGMRVREELQRAVLLGRPRYQQARGGRLDAVIDEILQPWCSDIDPHSLLRDLSAWQLARLQIALGVVPTADVVAIDGIGVGVPRAQQQQVWQWLGQWAGDAGVTVLASAIEVPGELPPNCTTIELASRGQVRAT
jgi:ABC-type multidrug transport system ATPase subunit